MRSGTNWLKAILIVAAAVIVPACNSNSKGVPPVITQVMPTTTASTIPNIIIEFDKAMDPATAGNVNYYGVYPGTSTTSIAFTVQYLSAVHQVRILPSVVLTGGTTYHVYVAGAVTSADGTAMGSTINFPVAVGTPTNTTSFIQWAGATAAQGTNPGEIDITWASNAQASVNGGAVGDIVANYDVYLSSTSGGQDFFAGSFASNLTSPITLTGLTSGLQYYMKVQPRDSEGNVFLALTEITSAAK